MGRTNEKLFATSGSSSPEPVDRFFTKLGM